MQFNKKQAQIHLLTAGVAFALAGVSYAQDAAPSAPAADQAKTEPAAEPQRPEAERRRAEFRRADPQRMLERMQMSFRELNLSEEQKTKIQAIVDKAKPQLEAIVKETEGKEPRERASKLREATQPVREEMMSVLDETQRQKLRELAEAARANRGNRAGGGAPMLQALKANLEKLGLNDEQKAKVETLIADTEKQFAAIRAEAGQGTATPPGANGETRAKFRELMQSNRKKLNEILTPEQREKLRELSPQRAGGQRGPDGAAGQPGQPGAAPAADDAPREPL